MTNKNQIKNPEYKNASELLSNLIDADTKVEQQINDYIQHYGVTKFLSKLDMLEFPAEIIEKLNAVKVILDVAKGGEVHD